jgi:outer membrane lipase/esterase
MRLVGPALVALCLALSASASGAPASGTPASGTPASGTPGWDRLVVLGDSLSDMGNAPGARFSDGPVWVEVLARRLGLPLAASSAGGGNHAVGGARAAGGGAGDLPAQRARYLASPPSGIERTLHVVWAGGNDLLEALRDGRAGEAAALRAAGAVAETVDRLAAAGARDVLVLDLPDLGRVPAVRSAGTAAVEAGRLLAARFDRALDEALDAVEARRGVRLHRLDLPSLMEGAGGAFKVVDRPCLGPGGACAEPGEHLFWDPVHPTAAAHARLAEAAFAALGRRS